MAAVAAEEVSLQLKVLIVVFSTLLLFLMTPAAEKVSLL